MSEALHANPEDRYSAFLGQLKHLLHEAEAARQLVTIKDLEQMEKRLLAEIREHSASKGDLAALDALLARSRRLAARLAALDARTPSPGSSSSSSSTTAQSSSSASS
jgi:hypothetical protein